MTTISQTALVAVSAQSRSIQLFLAALLGLFVVGFAGFAQSDVVHNAAHDYRHSIGFPCH